MQKNKQKFVSTVFIYLIYKRHRPSPKSLLRSVISPFCGSLFVSAITLCRVSKRLLYLFAISLLRTSWWVLAMWIIFYSISFFLFPNYNNSNCQVKVRIISCYLFANWSFLYWYPLCLQWPTLLFFQVFWKDSGSFNLFVFSKLETS